MTLTTLNFLIVSIAILSQMSDEFVATIHWGEDDVVLEKPLVLEDCIKAVRSTAAGGDPTSAGQVTTPPPGTIRSNEIIGTCTRTGTTYLITATDTFTAPTVGLGF